MKKSFNRTDRIAEQIKREVAKILQFEVKDDRLGMVTINAVKVSKDLAYADVYFTNLAVSLEESESLSSDSSPDASPNAQLNTSASARDKTKLSEKILNELSVNLRSLLAKSMRTRITPQLRFHYDDSLERGSRLSSLINKAMDSDKPQGDSKGR